MADVIRSNQSPYDGTGSNGGYCIEADVSSAKTGDCFHGAKIKANVEPVSQISPQEIEGKFAEITDVAGCNPLLRSRETSGSEYDNNITQSVIASLLLNLGCSEQQAWSLARTDTSRSEYRMNLLQSIVNSGNNSLTPDETTQAAAMAKTPRPMEVSDGRADLGPRSLFAQGRAKELRH